MNAKDMKLNPKRDPHSSLSVHAGLSYFVIRHHNCAPWWMLQFLIKRLFSNNIHDSSPCPIVQQPATVCAQSRNKDPAAERGHIAHCEFWRDLNLPSSQGNAVFYFDPCMLVGKTVCQGICKTHYGNQFFSISKWGLFYYNHKDISHYIMEIAQLQFPLT